MLRAAALAVIATWLGTASAAPPVKDRRIRVERPVLPVADQMLGQIAALDHIEYLRWPLMTTRHPALEPSYPLTQIAETGVRWEQLCARGIQSRRGSAQSEQVAYLRAWCEVPRRDSAAAVLGLAPLLHSPTESLRSAARIDIANILVDGGRADAAQEALAKAHVEELAVYDTIAAAYLEVGRQPEADTFNDLAIAADTVVSRGDHCHRLARRALLAPDDERGKRIGDFEQYNADRECARIAHELQCKQLHSCDGFLADRGFGPDRRRVLDAYRRWPTFTQPERWLEYAWSIGGRRMADPLFVSEADQLIVAALEAARSGLECTSLFDETRIYARNMLRSKRHDPTLDERLQALTEKGKCAR